MASIYDTLEKNAYAVFSLANEKRLRFQVFGVFPALHRRDNSTEKGRGAKVIKREIGEEIASRGKFPNR
jgi:hypothetical protein